MARPEDVAEVNRITPIISQYLNTLQAKHVSVLSALAIIIAKTIDECLLEQQRNPEKKTTPTAGQINVASVFDTRIRQLEQMGCRWSGWVCLFVRQVRWLFPLFKDSSENRGWN
ncbi:MAG: hypothetical protein A2248_18695 [Candidatus Raymondbacteria bacterium RIFOXYA2_FULL_49_16]|uniref:Uncharacterized protein n=1 Tax=Candidatus Raymondbacteria bacterium RIFOXYD12_FULL_49_13 TaxID=1817890 RepID=A0A1F7FAC8_UNCRA|nr:MAG: hypothetical protein A2248_18695 [Candidatus Raymondbacteria bacterium RIFOXYA2_FULL_49_16]OGJ97380.1 MAG: hypothetical protein A2453_03615 [Candidatus Raymondbacteria bacterium RIFOXYC2_FULL_50_21]OGK03571.1 MAG: hypothetical protein A2519_01870 [Candidatus Raymondbacteria bacterium RIFOXYD12_FULL_49_13]OGP42589.1 MAG: hypothetical protein A2324_06400 [Candidatus Raymondbacteria bacterium RIFOXYB2_FULL_49_35]